MDIDRETFIAIASPPCRECGAPIERTEVPWTLQGEGWVPGSAVMVCGNGHRIWVEPF